MISLTDTQRIGVGLMGFGVFFLLFGILLYFDRVLLGFGNILFISGLPFMTGLQNTFRFFYQRQKLKGSSFFLAGILLVLLRWPGVGMLCESYGLYLLFKSTLPLVSEFIASIPVLGIIFTLPGLSTGHPGTDVSLEEEQAVGLSGTLNGPLPGPVNGHQGQAQVQTNEEVP
ncbi:vesicle transport protein GOT1B-like [Pristis pectinata]|uniref:vesicle transport protein GOT1B-like n=1 Tax=Pristis pectinata TaxID=685728 RepID=UPI00223D7B2D|nr:vesicle transport protein GOT1B-like [Pristis pectinata]